MQGLANFQFVIAQTKSKLFSSVIGENGCVCCTINKLSHNSALARDLSNFHKQKRLENVILPCNKDLRSVTSMLDVGASQSIVLLCCYFIALKTRNVSRIYRNDSGNRYWSAFSDFSERLSHTYYHMSEAEIVL